MTFSEIGSGKLKLCPSYARIGFLGPGLQSRAQARFTSTLETNNNSSNCSNLVMFSIYQSAPPTILSPILLPRYFLSISLFFPNCSLSLCLSSSPWFPYPFFNFFLGKEMNLGSLKFWLLSYLLAVPPSSLHQLCFQIFTFSFCDT